MSRTLTLAVLVLLLGGCRKRPQPAAAPPPQAAAAEPSPKAATPRSPAPRTTASASEPAFPSQPHEPDQPRPAAAQKVTGISPETSNRKGRLPLWRQRALNY
jgi:hypothetical protein